MDVDNIQSMLNELIMDEGHDDEDLNEIYDDEEDLNNLEGSDDEEEINYAGQSSSNRTAQQVLDHVINNVLTDEQHIALKKGECFFCRKKEHFFRNCPSRTVYLKSNRKRRILSRQANHSRPVQQNKGKQPQRKPFQQNKKRRDPNAMVYGIEDDDGEDYDEFNSNENF